MAPLNWNEIISLVFATVLTGLGGELLRTLYNVKRKIDSWNAGLEDIKDLGTKVDSLSARLGEVESKMDKTIEGTAKFAEILKDLEALKRRIETLEAKHSQ